MSDETGIQLRNAAGEIVQYDYGEHAGSGMDTANEGGRIPFLNLLQSNSPEITSDEVEGARAGDFYIKTSERLYPGRDQGIYVIFLAEQHVFVEWRDRSEGGGWIADYAPDDPVVAQCRQRFGNDRKNWRTPAGNPLNETFRMYAVIVPSREDGSIDWDALRDPTALEPVIVSVDRTKLSARAKFFERIPRAFRRGGPLYAVGVRLRASKEFNNNNEPYWNLDFDFAEDDDFGRSVLTPDGDLWTAWAPEARRIEQAVKAGQIKAEEPAEGTAADSGSDPF